MTSPDRALFIQYKGLYDAYTDTKFILNIGESEHFFPQCMN